MLPVHTIMVDGRAISMTVVAIPEIKTTRRPCILRHPLHRPRGYMMRSMDVLSCRMDWRVNDVSLVTALIMREINFTNFNYAYVAKSRLHCRVKLGTINYVHF